MKDGQRALYSEIFVKALNILKRVGYYDMLIIKKESHLNLLDKKVNYLEELNMVILSVRERRKTTTLMER